MKTNNIKKGDTVRFLNAVGGGVVTGIDAQKGIIYVEDEDGFEIPALERECVAVPRVNQETNFPLKDFSSKPVADTLSEELVQKVPVETPKPVEIIETADGDELRALLAFIPVDIKSLQTSQYDCLLINDSNYFLFYNLIVGEKNQRRSVANGIIEPNMQEEILRIANADLNDWENLQVQVIPYKQSKVYVPQSAIDISLRIAPVKFYKLHSFTENDYFDELAMLIDLTNQKRPVMPEISSEEIKKAMLSKELVVTPKTQRQKVLLNPKIIEVDLHIHELIDETAGLNNADMLQLQLDKFHAVIEENKQKKGQKIVFIHGKGEGVLRNEILKQLKTRYKSYFYQDASFKEYGFGATMVVIR